MKSLASLVAAALLACSSLAPAIAANIGSQSVVRLDGPDGKTLMNSVVIFCGMQFADGTWGSQVCSFGGSSTSGTSGSVTITGTLPGFSSTPTFNLGTLNGAALDSSVQAIRTALGNPFQVGGSVTLTGTLPGFTTTPTFNFGTLNGAALDSSLQSIKTALGNPFQVGGAVSLTGSLPAFGSTPTFNLGTLNGAALDSSLQSIKTTLGTPFQAGGLATITPRAATFASPGCTVGTSAASCLASGLAANHVTVENVSSTASIACSWTTTAALNAITSFQLAPGQPASWGLNTGGIPTGTLSCIATAASTPLYVEYN